MICQNQFSPTCGGLQIGLSWYSEEPIFGEVKWNLIGLIKKFFTSLRLNSLKIGGCPGLINLIFNDLLINMKMLF
jgi:hypothetical protein